MQVDISKYWGHHPALRRSFRCVVLDTGIHHSGCVVDIRKYRTLSIRVPAVIHVMDLIRSEGKDGLTKILEKWNAEAQA
jgi:hypothetical protein